MLENIERQYLDKLGWIPAFAGMTGIYAWWQHILGSGLSPALLQKVLSEHRMTFFLDFRPFATLRGTSRMVRSSNDWIGWDGFETTSGVGAGLCTWYRHVEYTIGDEQIAMVYR